jgi:hypothetical protein
MPRTEESTANVEESEACAKATFLLRMISERIDSFQKRREKNRKTAFRLKMSIAALGAMTTILLGLQVANPHLVQYIKNLALCTSSLITIVATWESFFDYRGLWVRYTATRARLMALRAQLDFMLAGNRDCIEVANINKLFDQYENILEETNSSWLQGRLGKQHADSTLKPDL